MCFSSATGKHKLKIQYIQGAFLELFYDKFNYFEKSFYC